MKILLIDLCTTKGHHEIYFTKILSALTKNGYFVYATCTDNLKLRKTVEVLNIKNCQILDLKLTLVDKILIKSLLLVDRVVSILSLRRLVKFSSLTNLIATRRLIAQIREQVTVFFAHADSVIPTVPTAISNIFMPTNWVGLQIQPSYQAVVSRGQEGSRRIFYAEKNFSLSSCKSILVLHPIYRRFYSLRFHNKPFIFLPELLEYNSQIDSSIARTIQSLSSDRKIFSVIGCLTPKRNLLLFLETALCLSPNKFFIVVVGYLRSDDYSIEEVCKIRSLVQQLSENSFVRLDYYIPTEEEFNSLLELSDLVFLHYKSHPYSSNILIKCMALQKPVIVGRGYLMERTVKHYDWSAVVGDSPEEIAQIIPKTLSSFRLDKGRYLEFLAQHSEAQFESSILIACEQAERESKKKAE